MAQAFFGPPAGGFVRGGAHIAVYLVPVFEGRLVVFDVPVREARGRWLPWTVMGFGENPYETAAELADDWCESAVSSLEIVDALSFPFEGEGWELALVYRAELTMLPPGDDARRPFAYPRGEADAIGRFDPVDLLRWVGNPPGPGEVRGGGAQLVF